MSDALRLLLLEDSPADAELNERELRKAGLVFVALRVDREETLRAALDAFAPDLILADYHLPGFDGLLALAICREHSPATPFVFVTGAMGEELAAESIRAGATDYILKDRLARLPAAVQRALEERQGRIERNHYLNQVGQAMRGTVAALARTVEMRDPYTAGHQQRVATLAAALGRTMGLSEQVIEGLQFGGMIHDIGKIAVPAEILNKPTRLTGIEYQLIQQHAAYGHQIIAELEFPWPLAEMIVQHHERIDGSGYPSGLRGEEIILESRILAVADVVEAMSSHRPYRAALGMEFALAEIEAGKGSRYDPLVVEACIQVIRAAGMTLPDG
ncbi:MAG TPA: HD domain-containing phosphohydrolase [Lamprocystis sp. (in: g-proteobacteria)]|nr:HD domain-containing phosphohydrolase [Lamprocystis sp. (in: g-proteobacteria)]